VVRYKIIVPYATVTTTLMYGWIYVNSKDSKPSSKEYPFEEGW